jgi:putative two-component system response regulator
MQTPTAMTIKKRILIVDDTPANIKILHEILRDDYRISMAANGGEALELAFSDTPPDLILLDIVMPGMDGHEVCRLLKGDERTSQIPILFVTSRNEEDDEARSLALGATDYITKPFSPAIVKSRVKNHMELHVYQVQLEELVSQRTRQIQEAYIDTIHRLCLASEYKDKDTGAHIKRISHFTKELATRMGLGHNEAEKLFYASPMHDIGKVAIPDAILLKPGAIDAEEWQVIMGHTTIGANILRGSSSPFLQSAVDIAWCHHERWDGGGYPRGLKGEEIPLSARIMNIADQYDALRNKRPYKEAYDHVKAVRIIVFGDSRTMPDHFDPAVLTAFKEAADAFEKIFASLEDEEKTWS